jgi:hypothetical protein
MCRSEFFVKPIAASLNVAIGSVAGGAATAGKGPGDGEPQKRANLTLSPLRRTSIPRDSACAFFFVESPLSWGW